MVESRIPKQPLSRREFLALSGLGAAALSAACSSPIPVSRLNSSVDSPPPERACRIAHLTDFHILPQSYIQDQVAKAFRHVQALEDAPDFILNTGDSIMDSLKTSKEDAERQWQAFLEVVERECKLPIYHAIGNHDVWGWGLKEEALKKDPLYGKGFALQKLGLSSPYYAFDHGGWHFIVLDSIHPANAVSKEPYIGLLDEEQFRWLEGEVQSVTAETPIAIASHIPILSACELFDGENERSGNWVVPAAWVHLDARRFRQLFLEHPNIRLCLSGHSHQHERIEYLGVTYLSDGAISGNWWMGSYMNFPPAYVIVDLFRDGSVRSQFVEYG
jgi:3',5'-cyclic AMP phosphodiesterase CpdA